MRCKDKKNIGICYHLFFMKREVLFFIDEDLNELFLPDAILLYLLHASYKG